MIVITRIIKLLTIKAINRPITNIIDATNIGFFKIFCKAIDIIITASGNAKNISKNSIIFLLFFLLYFMHFSYIWLTKNLIIFNF